MRCRGVHGRPSTGRPMCKDDEESVQRKLACGPGLSSPPWHPYPSMELRTRAPRAQPITHRYMQKATSYIAQHRYKHVVGRILLLDSNWRTLRLQHEAINVPSTREWSRLLRISWGI